MAANIELPPLPSIEDLPENVNAGDGLLIMSWVLLGLSTVLVSGRIISKTYVIRRFRWDDVCLLTTWVTSVVYTAALQLSYHDGLGRHSIYLGIEKSIKLIRWAYVCQVFCIVTPLMGRLTVTIYTVNLLGRTRPWLRWSLWGLLWLQVLTNISLLVVLLSLCGFDITEVANPATTCYRQSAQSIYAEAVSGFNGFTDGALTIAPTILIWSLRTTTRAKLAASFLLGFSILAMAASIWRTIELKVIFAGDWDFTHNAVPYFYASSFEQSSIIIAAAIPTLGPVFKHVRSEHHPKHIKNASTGRSTSASNRSDSCNPWEEDDKVQAGIAHALGIQMPGLGNTVTITAGKNVSTRTSRREDANGMPLSDIKATRKTNVKVEPLTSYPAFAYASQHSPKEDDVEKLLRHYDRA